VIAEPLGVELRVQLAKVFITIVAEEAAHPSFGSQRFSFVVGIDLRRQASGSEEHVTAGLECPKFKAFAWLNSDCSYLEVSEEGDGSRDQVTWSAGVREPYLDRPCHIETDVIDLERVEVHLAAM